MQYNKDNPLKVFEAFAGYGSQSVALERLKRKHPGFDYKVVGISEIEMNAIAAYNALHGHPTPPPNFGSITEIDWSHVPNFDLLTYSFPCFVADTLILTDKGYKPIQDVQRGELVMTHLGRFKRVNAVMQREYRGPLMHIKAIGVNEIICTPEHPFFVTQKKAHADNADVFQESNWKDAKCLNKADYLHIPINDKSQLPNWGGCIDNRWGHGKIVNNLECLFNNESFWYLMGRYVGDGWRIKCKSGNKVYIACSSRNKDSLTNAIKQIGFNYCIDSSTTCDKVIICSNELFDFVGRYGYRAIGKCVDGETIDLPRHLLSSFINGVIDSDGCSVGKYTKITTISKKLAYGLSLCVNKVYKVGCSLYLQKRPKNILIQGRLCNQHDSYELVFKKVRNTMQDRTFPTDRYILTPITNVQAQYAETTVYNLSVEDDESYVANGVAVHNCQDISASGLQKGFDEDSSTRSSLLWQVRKAVVAKRPKFLLMENVKALTQKKFMPLFNKWQQELEHYGYTNFYKVLNATQFNVPQNRERVFMVSILGAEQDYQFPQPTELTKTIADVLEQDVGEQYFLNQHVVEKYLEVTADTTHNHNLGLRSRSDIAFTIRAKAGGRVDDNYIAYVEEK